MPADASATLAEPTLAEPGVTRPTRAMVLAAGLGRRMMPLTTLLPKPALPVLNRPLIVYCLDHLAAHGVTFVVINTHHLPDRLEQAVLRSVPDGMQVIFSHEGSILGTAGGLRKAARHFQGGAFYMVNSDSLTDVDLTGAYTAHARSGRTATMVVKRHRAESGYRPVGVVAGGGSTERVAAIGGKRWGREDLTQRTFTGVHVLEPRVLEAIPAGAACDINADIYPWLLDEDPDSVGAWLHDGWWFEAGGPARYLDLNLEMLARSNRDAVVGPRFFIDEEARVDRSVLGAGARLARGCLVERSVIWDDVTVGEGVSLRRCIVTHGAEVPLMSLEGTIVVQDESGELHMSRLEAS